MLILASVIGALFTSASYLYQTSVVAYSSGHPGAISYNHGYPLPFYNDTSLDASDVSYHQFNVFHAVADFILFFAVATTVIAVLILGIQIATKRPFAVHQRSQHSWQ